MVVRSGALRQLAARPLDGDLTKDDSCLLATDSIPQPAAEALKRIVTAPMRGDSGDWRLRRLATQATGDSGDWQVWMSLLMRECHCGASAVVATGRWLLVQGDAHDD